MKKATKNIKLRSIFMLDLLEYITFKNRDAIKLALYRRWWKARDLEIVWKYLDDFYLKKLKNGRTKK